MGIETIEGEKKIICTITFQKVKSFSCDLLIMQKVPSDSSWGDLGGTFKRIQNTKILQIEASESEWGIDVNENRLGFFKPKSSSSFLHLDGVGSNFLDNVINGYATIGTGWIWTPPNEINWRLFATNFHW
jgi:hypothetical protein